MSRRGRQDGLAALACGVQRLHSSGCVGTGSAALAYRAAEDAAPASLASVALPASVSYRHVTDEFGFSWVELTSGSDDDLVPALVAVAAAVADPDAGAGDPLCALMGWRGPAGRLFAIVFRFDTGTFYPFVPELDADADTRQRDNLTELRLRDLLDWTLPMERDLRLWGALWDAPGLR